MMHEKSKTTKYKEEVKSMKKLEDYVTSIPDFPEPGIIFRDVTTILQDADGLSLAVDGVRGMLKDVDYDVVVGPESRGFIFGVPVAYAEHKGFVPVRKKGKLPREVISADYELEYGQATIEMHRDSTSYPSNFSLPFKPFNSMIKQIFTTSPPISFISPIMASIVPPVAIKSSMITTFWPGFMESLCISTVALPYSSS